MAPDFRDEGLRAAPTEIVASYAAYADAARAVDDLAGDGFRWSGSASWRPIYGFVEQVTGRQGYRDGAIEGAASGALTGALLGFVLGLFSLVTPLASGLALAWWGLVFGAAIGPIAGLVWYAIAGHRRFSSVAALDAGRTSSRRRCRPARTQAPRGAPDEPRRMKTRLPPSRRR